VERLRCRNTKTPNPARGTRASRVGVGHSVALSRGNPRQRQSKRAPTSGLTRAISAESGALAASEYDAAEACVGMGKGLTRHTHGRDLVREGFSARP